MIIFILLLSFLTAIESKYNQQQIHFPAIEKRGSKMVQCDDKLIISTPEDDYITTFSYVEPFWQSHIFTSPGLWGFGDILVCDKTDNTLIVGFKNTIRAGFGEIKRYTWSTNENNWLTTDLDSLIDPSTLAGTRFGSAVWAARGVIVATAPFSDSGAQTSVGKLHVFKNGVKVQELLPPSIDDQISYRKWGIAGIGYLTDSHFVLLDGGLIYAYTVAETGELTYVETINFSLDDFAKNIAIGGNVMVVSDGTGGVDKSGVIQTFVWGPGGGWKKTEQYLTSPLIPCKYCMFGRGDLKIDETIYLTVGSSNYDSGVGCLHTFTLNVTSNTWTLSQTFTPRADPGTFPEYGTYVERINIGNSPPIFVASGSSRNNNSSSGVISFQETALDTSNPPVINTFAVPLPPGVPNFITSRPTGSPGVTPGGNPGESNPLFTPGVTLGVTLGVVVFFFGSVYFAYSRARLKSSYDII